MSRVLVIGGGAAGMMAAAAAAGKGHQVQLYEKNEKLGKKIYITGKGRCNLTNNCGPEELLQAVCTNRKFLYHAFYGFTSQDTMRFFEESGLSLKTERGNRVFPVSDHSSDVIAALAGRLRRAGVSVHLNEKVEGLLLTESGNQDAQDKSPARRICGVSLASGKNVEADAVIVATGGLCYPSTGSTGDGYRFAAQAGHQILPCMPSLVPFQTAGDLAQRMQGLSLRNVEVSIYDPEQTPDTAVMPEKASGKQPEKALEERPEKKQEPAAADSQGKKRKKQGRRELFREFGEMMFTHFGVTGPVILTASTIVQKQLSQHALELEIDLKPALSGEQLDARLLREFEAAGRKQLKNVLGSLFPAKLIPAMLSCCELPGETPVCALSREQRQRLIFHTKHFSLTLTGLRDYNEAIITRGGVNVKEVNPATMESRLVKGLYFAGEVLDLDAVTGGFNLQIAWATGHAAGMAAGW